MNLVLQTRRRKKISLTPLIDIVFILLLFFMLSSSFKRWQVIDLTSAQASEHPGDESELEPLFLLLYESGEVKLWPNKRSWNKASEIKMDELEPLKSEKQLRPAALLVPEKKTNIQTMIDALEHLDSLGVNAQLTEPVGAHPSTR